MTEYRKTNIVSDLSKKVVIQLNFLSIDEFLKLGRTNMLCCISAFTPENIKVEDMGKQKTQDLQDSIATTYDFVKIQGGWVNNLDGEKKNTTENCFIAIGPEHSGDESNKKCFKKNMLLLCKEYKQKAILIVEGIEFEENIKKEMRNNHSDAYKVFLNPKYMTEDCRASVGVDLKNKVKDIYEKTNENEGDCTIFQVNAKYYNENGDVIKEYNNISKQCVSDFFTSIYRDAGASGFSLIASVRPEYIEQYYATTNADHFSRVGYIGSKKEGRHEAVLRNYTNRYYQIKKCYDFSKYIEKISYIK